LIIVLFFRTLLTLLIVK